LPRAGKASVGQRGWPSDQREVVTYDRMEAAGASRSEIRDIPVTVYVSNHKRADGELPVDLTIDPSRVAFVRAGNGYTTSLDVAVFVGDAGQKLIGEVWARIDLNLDETAHARVLRDGIVHASIIRVAGRPRHIKVVIYDYEADRLGTAIRRLQ
jgi:hypothetical protein